MKTTDILHSVPILSSGGGFPEEISGVHHDSRLVTPGGVFVARPGHRTDGNAFLDDAVERGAAIVVSERSPEPGSLAASVAWLQVSDARVALAQLSAGFHGHPSTRMDVVGITGTNGKTTTAHLVEGLLKAAGREVGLLSTVVKRWAGHEEASSLTTPEATELQASLAQMARGGVDSIVLEVSSHAIAQHRVAEVDFDVTVFTNLGWDHLDYHGSREEYAAVKTRLFTDLQAASPSCKGAVICTDDPVGQTIADVAIGDIVRYGVDSGSPTDLRAENIKTDLNGICATVAFGSERISIQSPLVGMFNARNLLAALGSCLLLGIPLSAAAGHMANLTGAPGRLLRVDNTTGITVFVDYAHTADALENVLGALRGVAQQRIVTVFGCGGGRDRGKRPLMGRAAAIGSDVVVVTSDNPRDEPPDFIISEAEAGVVETGMSVWDESTGLGYLVEVERHRAIEMAVALAVPGDVLLIAGKGHETYQEIGGHMRPFDDAEHARAALRRKEGGES